MPRPISGIRTPICQEREVRQVSREVGDSDTIIVAGGRRATPQCPSYCASQYWKLIPLSGEFGCSVASHERQSLPHLRMWSHLWKVTLQCHIWWASRRAWNLPVRSSSHRRPHTPTTWYDKVQRTTSRLRRLHDLRPHDFHDFTTFNRSRNLFLHYKSGF